MRALHIGRCVLAAVCWTIAMTPVLVCAQAAIPDTIGQRLAACSLCHGKGGIANGREYFSRIAGKPAGYLYNQLQNFREGRRSNATMASFVANMTDAYLLEIATYYASLDLPYSEPSASPVESQVLARGQALVEHGDESIGVPACVRCYGDALTGMLPSVPGLVGCTKSICWRNLEVGKRASDGPLRPTACERSVSNCPSPIWARSQTICRASLCLVRLGLYTPLSCRCRSNVGAARNDVSAHSLDCDRLVFRRADRRRDFDRPLVNVRGDPPAAKEDGFGDPITPQLAERGAYLARVAAATRLGADRPMPAA